MARNTIQLQYEQKMGILLSKYRGAPQQMNTSESYATKVCIVGLGPAGIGAAVTFMKSNLPIDILCMDAGTLFNNRSCLVLQGRSCDKEECCQVISGLGGCSLYGGKISLFPAGSGFLDLLGSEELVQRKIGDAFKLLNHYISLEGPKLAEDKRERAKKFFERLGFRYKYYNVYLYDQVELRKALHKVLMDLKSSGAILLERTSLINIESRNNHFEILARRTKKEIVIHCNYIVLGIGRLGAPLLRSLNSKLNLNGKESHVEVGVRIEFPTELYPDIDKYHKDLKLFFNNASVLSSKLIDKTLIKCSHASHSHGETNNKDHIKRKEQNLSVVLEALRSRNGTAFVHRSYCFVLKENHKRRWQRN